MARSFNHRPVLEVLEDRLPPSSLLGRGATDATLLDPGLLLGAAVRSPGNTTLTAAAESRGANSNPGIVPPNAHAYGQTYGEWAASFTRWAFTIPVDRHPLFDNGPFAPVESGHVWFLGGSFSSATLHRTVEVPTGKALFFPLTTYAAFLDPVPGGSVTPGFDGKTVDEIRASAKAVIDSATNLSATIDGVAVNNLGTYRVQSPVFNVPVKVGSVLDGFSPVAPVGSHITMVADGYFLLVKPLSPGPHTLHFTADVPGFHQDFTYDIQVLSGGKS
jgi:hypothetical protein